MTRHLPVFDEGRVRDLLAGDAEPTPDEAIAVHAQLRGRFGDGVRLEALRQLVLPPRRRRLSPAGRAALIAALRDASELRIIERGAAGPDHPPDTMLCMVVSRGPVVFDGMVYGVTLPNGNGG